MKRLFLVLLMSVLLVSFGQTAWSEEASQAQESPVIISAGLTSWYLSFSDNSVLKQSDSKSSSLLVGPRLNFSYKGFFAGASYITSIIPLVWGSKFSSTYDINDYKSYLNLIAGYMIIPNVGVFGGYLYNSSSLSYANFNVKRGENSLKGPGLGITTNLPIGEALYLYLNGSWMFATFQWEGASAFTRNVLALDGGLIYKFNENATASLGWKHQINFLYNLAGTALGTETYSGPAVSFTWSFTS